MQLPNSDSPGKNGSCDVLTKNSDQLKTEKKFNFKHTRLNNSANIHPIAQISTPVA